jgi:ABC-type branched-subunit amino acid transport system ATPase component
MLVIGRAIMAEPKLMMIDEPSLGLAPLMVEEVFTVLLESLKRERPDAADRRAEHAGGAGDWPTMAT